METYLDYYGTACYLTNYLKLSQLYNLCQVI